MLFSCENEDIGRYLYLHQCAFNRANYDEESIIVKYRCKVKEDETRNVINWNEHFGKLKETRSEEQGSNEIDNLLKVTSATKRQPLKMCHLRHRLRIFLFHRKIMFHSQDI